MLCVIKYSERVRLGALHMQVSFCDIGVLACDHPFIAETVNVITGSAHVLYVVQTYHVAHTEILSSRWTARLVAPAKLQDISAMW